MVNAIARTIPTANTNLAGFGFGAMYPSWRQIDVAMPDFRGANWKRCMSYFTLRGTHIITGGTGKYKGITGSEPFACITMPALAGPGGYTAMDIPHNTTWEIK